MRAFNPLLLVLAIAGGLLAPGCSKVPPTAFQAGQGQLRSLGTTLATTVPQASFEEAFPVARSTAEAIAGGPVAIIDISGNGVGKDGRLVAGSAPIPGGFEVPPYWTFGFVKRGDTAQPRRQIHVEVAKSGQVSQRDMEIGPGDPPSWDFDSRGIVPASLALSRAMADGLIAKEYTVRLAPIDSAFGSTGKTSFFGPVAFFIFNGDRLASQDYRVVSTKTGQVPRKATAAEQDQVRKMATWMATRWHFLLTLSGTRPVVEPDLIRSGYTAEEARAFLGQFDKNGDKKASPQEMIAAFTHEQALRMFREFIIKFPFWQADGDHDEVLTQVEARSVKAEWYGPRGDVVRWPLGIKDADFRGADASGDGRLDIDEYAPLGLSKTLEVLEGNPELVKKAINTWIRAIPWSH